MIEERSYLYTYYRNGVEFVTTNERVAQIRTDEPDNITARLIV
tara:strand:- start:599 stop:727 length:129 start_codon:yes stop_codon:yes gene_type:complete